MLGLCSRKGDVTELCRNLFEILGLNVAIPFSMASTESAIAKDKDKEGDEDGAMNEVLCYYDTAI